MQLRFPDIFNRETKDSLGIRPNHVERLVADPDTKQEQLDFEDDFSLRLCAGRVKAGKREQYLVAWGQQQGDALTVLGALRVYDDFAEAAAAKTPLELLEAVVERFGVELTVARELKAKFVYRRAFPLPERLPPAEYITVTNAERHDLLPQQFLRAKDEGGGKTLSVALAFCLDRTRYRDYVAEHKR